MRYAKSLVLIFTTTSLLLGCGLSGSNSEPTDQQQREIAERIAPVGEILMASDMVNSAPIIAMDNIQKVALSVGSEHTVKMLNQGEGGNMIFEPAVLKVSLGDTVHFKAG